MAASQNQIGQELTDQQVLHLATLARLRLAAEQISMFRTQLASVLHHVSKLNELDVTDVAPLAHPLDLSANLASDSPAPQISPELFLQRAPATEGALIAVPKVLADETSS
ncbi:MAG TPA: Asp-tRNA(Asn)/Glu-tRNA(Gln) amidotransferase subunit GatC [Phycisphaerales bacterium]|nr:Asp-tRNA(Asn)/Glu-tRNA(Gln) amidotransferase subunit GatC [Phycisphaerales bacterium]